MKFQWCPCIIDESQGEVFSFGVTAAAASTRDAISEETVPTMNREFTLRTR